MDDKNDAVAPWSAHLALTGVIEKLKRNHGVNAIGYLGSTGTRAFTDSSDYDLLIALDDYPAGYGIEASIIGQRVADLVIIASDRAAALTGGNFTLANGAAWSHSTGEAPQPARIPDAEWAFISWLAAMRPVFDPHGLARRAQERAAELCQHRPPVSDDKKLATRSFLSQDVRVNDALLRRSKDPLARMASGMRQLHTFVAAVQARFTVRGLGRRIRSLAGQDELGQITSRGDLHG